jgi:hypothetical protein
MSMSPILRLIIFLYELDCIKLYWSNRNRKNRWQVQWNLHLPKNVRRLYLSHVCKKNILNVYAKKKNIEYCGWFSYNVVRVPPIQDNLSWHIYYQLIKIYLYCNRCMYWQYKDVRINMCFIYLVDVLWTSNRNRKNRWQVQWNLHFPKMCVGCIYSASHVCKKNILNVYAKKKNIEYCGWFSYNVVRWHPSILT